MNTSTDRIEKRIVLNAPRSRVWRALTNADEFGAWFRVDLAGQTFEAGRCVEGRITYPGYEHLVLRMRIERIEPEHRFSYHWHPAAIDPAVDYAQETPRSSCSSWPTSLAARCSPSSNRASISCRSSAVPKRSE
ncbi:Activator of Hsp90 ATPase 1 family protein [Burkholderia pseudomallei]|nr:Activator of Hsp90 ATPase 1 family protein [Burkholderia pseudomallei]CAJ3733289.1 Activator of Hsp90 ATPase 1 family protein [Burkholderia pseudomallei]CAJ4138754.1 Activator of Hsp90 ATPase 1 family protein [Burkholderia pseudomallei]CAJ4297943.1 Activator of Hsp90 ATPase 1 family protein [Burkholderia pseudomallei]CAJ4657715.1 Activator of Hsp90 ATPase 1 family protein [Burkholderia pseudomallei]